MKKFLTVLLALSVVFTYTVGTAFAATGTTNPADVTSNEIAEFKAAIGSEAAALQSALVTAGQKYMNSLNFNSDDEVTLTTSSVTVSKSVMQEIVDDAVYDAQLEIDKLAVKLQDNVTAANLSNASYDSIDDWKTLLRVGLTGSEFASVTTAMPGYDDLSDIQNAVEVDVDLAKAQYKADLKAAQEKLAGYLANVDKYSDNASDWYVMDNNANYENTGWSVASLAGITPAATAAKISAKAFVKGVVETQSAAVNTEEAAVKQAEDAATTAAPVAYTVYTGASTNINDAVKKATTIVEGQKIDTAAGINNYVPAVPTAEELAADTTLDGQKATAIRQMKADLNSAAIKMETVLKTELSDENKKAKPDAKKVSELNAAIAALDAQIAATEEVYTALINYCENKTDIDNLTAVGGKIGSEIALFNAVNSYTKFLAANDAEAKLKANVVITENVDALEAEAALLALQKDVNGKLLHDADALKKALEEQTEELYKSNVTLPTAKNALYVGAEVALAYAKANYVNYINNVATTGFQPKDKNGNKITTITAWNDVNGDRTLTANVTVNGTTVVTAGKVALYDKAQKDALKALIAETEDAIKAAKTVGEIETIFAAAHEKYKDIPTTADHEADWTNGKLATANAKAGYGAQISTYANHLMSTVDASKYGVSAADLEEVGNCELYKAYTTDELAAKFADAKAAMLNALKTKDEVNAAKANVEKLIDAIGTVTIDSKEAIVAAADALSDYKDIPGTKLNVANESKLITAKTAYEVLAAKALDDAFKALDAKKITVADAEAVEALRAQYDDYAAYCDDYDVAQTAKTNDNTLPDTNSVKKLEKELSEAKVAAVREMMIKLPANPTEAQRAEVEAARAAYEALSLDEQTEIVGSLPWRNLIDAEEALGVYAIKAVEALKITASSSAVKGKITVKWKVKGDAAGIDGYQVYKSTKAQKNYKFMGKTAKTSMVNKKGIKKGTRYFYKVRAYKVVDGVKYYSDWSNKANRIAK